MYLDANIIYFEDIMSNYRRSRINSNSDVNNFLYQSSQGKFNSLQNSNHLKLINFNFIKIILNNHFLEPKLIFPEFNSIVKSTRN